MIKIDGETYDVSVYTIKRNADFFYKYAKRLTSGTLAAKLIGVYFNYSMTFGFPRNNTAEYHRLWNKLSEPTPFHTITTYDETGEYTYTCYIAELSDEISYVNIAGSNTTVYCKGLTAEFIAKSPARKPGGSSQST